jgi:putative FmdB family regulatory protein
MPTYEYRCNKCGEHFEVVQSFSDEALKQHPGKCRGKVVKVLSAAGIVFSGSGFYKTDNRRSSRSGSSEGGSKSSSSGDSGRQDSSSSSGSNSDSKDSGSGSKDSSSSSKDSGGSGSKDSGSSKPSGESKKSA